MNKGKIEIVVGGQVGSEAKGHYVSCTASKHDVAVRTGAPNAGHTVFYKGKPYAMQQIPCSWINPKTTLVLGAGSLIDIEYLERELDWIESAHGMRPKKILIDYRASVLEELHTKAEEHMHEMIGSTSKGCGEALIDRIRRKGNHDLFGEHPWAKKYHDIRYTICDTQQYLMNRYNRGDYILLEGTQGSALSLYFGTEYPYCTSRDTNASNWLMECGLAPSLNISTTLVFRTYPIRVAGNSGKYGKELSWIDLAMKRAKSMDSSGYNIKDLKSISNLEQIYKSKAENGEIPKTDVHLQMMKDVPLAKHMMNKINDDFSCITTVSKKFRRVFEFNKNEANRAMSINQPDTLVLNFLNYEFPELEDVHTTKDLKEHRLFNAVDEFCIRLLGKRPNYVNTNRYSLIKYPEIND